MGRYFCKQIWPFWLDNRDVQECNKVKWHLGKETSLAPPCPNLRSYGSKHFEKSACDIVMTFGDSAPGELCRLSPSLRLWRYAIKSENFPKINKFSSPNVMNFYSMNICNFRTQSAYGMDLAQTANKRYCRHFKFLCVVFVSLLMLPHAFFRRGPVFVLLIIKIFRHSTSYFFEVR